MPDSLSQRRRSWWFDAFALLALAAALWNWLVPGWVSVASPAVVYVSPTGSDWFSSGMMASPVATITEALRRVRNTGTVRILDGDYVERVHVRRGGVDGRPLVIEAVNPGRATITWKAQASLPVESEWREEGDGIFSAKVRWPVYWMRNSGKSMLNVPYGGMRHLRHLVQLPFAQAAFTNSDGRLFLFLNGRHPRDCDIQSHREVPLPREWGVHKSSNLWIEADHVTIRGLAFDFGVGSGIRVAVADGIQIENCAFTGATHGIRSDRHESCHLAVDRCIYHNYPQREWTEKWLGWEQMYACYPDNGLLNAPAPIVQATRNVAVHCADGIHVSSESLDLKGRSHVQGNWIGFTSDDGLELDGFGRNLDVDSNLLLDCFVGISCSPIREGPVRIHGNVCWNREPHGENAHLKWLTPTSIGKDTRNMVIDDNLFVGGTACYWREQPAVIDTEVRDNVFALRRRLENEWPATVRLVGNEVHSLDNPKELSPDQLSGVIAATSAAAHWKSRISSVLERAGPEWWSLEDHPATEQLAEFVVEVAGLAR